MAMTTAVMPAVMGYVLGAAVGVIMQEITSSVKKRIKTSVVKGFVKEAFKEGMTLAVEERITTIKGFRSHVRSIEDRLISVKSLVAEAREYTILTDPSNEQLRPIYDMLTKCQDLVDKTKTLRKRHLFDKLDLSKQLEVLDNQIVRFCTVDLVAILTANAIKQANYKLQN